MEERNESSFSRRRLIRDGALMVVAGSIRPALLCERAEAEDLKASDPAIQSWVIANGQIERAVSFNPKVGLYTNRLSDLTTRQNFIVPEKIRVDMAAEFSFQCNGRQYEGNSGAFELLGADERATVKGKSLTIRLRQKEVPLEVSVVYHVYDGHPAVRKHLVLRNSGSASLRFSHLNIEALGISIGPQNETTLNAQYGTIPREIFYTGRSEDAGLFIANGLTGGGLAVLSEVPGYMKRTEIGGWDNPDRVRIGVLYDTDLMPFERTLAAGEEFRRS